MRKFLLFLFLISFMSSAHSELKIKIQKAEIGALPIIISIKGDSEIFSSKNFSSIIENDLYGSGYFNILDSSKIKTSIKNTNTQYNDGDRKSKILCISGLAFSTPAWKSSVRGAFL